MYSHKIQLRVRYAETDQMGYVYYGNYAMYYEVARVEAFRQLGFVYKKLEENGIMMPVLEMHSEFLRAGKYDELLDVEVTIPELPGAKITFLYNIFNQENMLINKGKTLLAFINMESGRPCRPPEQMLDLLEPYFK